MKLKLKNNKTEGEEEVYLLIDMVDYENPDTEEVIKQPKVVGELRMSALDEELATLKETIAQKEAELEVARLEYKESIDLFKEAVKRVEEYKDLIKDARKKAGKANSSKAV